MNDLKEILSRYNISIAGKYSLTTGQTTEYLFDPKIPFVYKGQNIPVEIHWTAATFILTENHNPLTVYINSNTCYHIGCRTTRASSNQTDKYLPMSFEEQIFETVIDLYQVLKKYNFNIPKELL